MNLNINYLSFKKTFTLFIQFRRLSYKFISLLSTAKLIPKKKKFQYFEFGCNTEQSDCKIFFVHSFNRSNRGYFIEKISPTFVTFSPSLPKLGENIAKIDEIFSRKLFLRSKQYKKIQLKLFR